jgi:hypothetical protein
VTLLTEDIGNIFLVCSALLLLLVLLGLWACGQRFFSVVHISTDLLLGLAQTVAGMGDDPERNRSKMRGPAAVCGFDQADWFADQCGGDVVVM